MAAFAALTAPVKWAQRKDSVLVTISLADVKDYSVTNYLYIKSMCLILLLFYYR